MTQANAIKLIVTVVVIALLTLLQNVINTRRDHRGRQVLLPIIAAVFSLVGTVVLLIRYDWIQSICGKYEFLSDGNVFVLNILLMLTFILIKCLVCPILSSKWKSYQLMDLTTVRFYEYDEIYSEWFLKKRWADFRRIGKAFSLCGAVLCAVLLGLTWVKGAGSLAWVHYVPCAALIVINEAWNFINGQTREEFEHSFLGDEADARRVGNFYRIREIYEKLFAPQMLASHTGCEFSARQGATALLKKMEGSEDPVEQNVAQFYLTYSEKMAFDPDCIQASSHLMHGNSVAFFDPFYRDLGAYLTLPLVNSLLKGKKCLVIAGRASTSQDAVVWLTDLLKDYSHVRSMWRVKKLNQKEPECEVGVLSFQQLYDVDVLAVNRTFFHEADFVLLLEPSAMINTGQVGLSIISEEMNRYDDAPVYCICDRYTDSLVDTMSHLLRTEITDVVAMPVPRCIYTGMVWNADGDFLRQKLFDKQTRFLGNGIELAAVAVKNQVPQVTWYSETKAPLRDIKWIAGQHHSTVCRYMNLPAQQKSLYEKIHFVPNLWCTKSTQEQFIIAEDEFCNMFSMMRTFLSRGDSQVFVNILSENYLLRDYMRCNQQMFFSNPNAIPSLAPDYAKTERNTLLKLVILMAFRSVAEGEIADELRLAGCVVEDTFDSLSQLLKKYTFVDGSVLEIKSVNESADSISARTVNYFSIPEAAFDTYFAKSLKNAYYIVEDEKRDSEFIDAKMFGHITQTILPGQFVVYDGKYYEVRMISPENGIILRRASDLYTGRKYYRQIRMYHFEKPPASAILYSRKMMGMEIFISSCDFSVTTTGYLEMRSSHDLRMAKAVDFQADPSVHNYDRSYRNKNVLCIKLPDTDDKIRFTICLLLSEVFRSVFPNGWQYLAVMSKRPDDIEGMLNHVVYTLDGEVDEDNIYVVEDSDLDLGLLDAVNRSLPQLFEIVADFLDWHFEKMREPEHRDPVPTEVKMPEEEKRRNLFLKMADRIRKLLSGKSEKVRIDTPEKVEKEAEKAGNSQREQPAENPDNAEESDAGYTLDTDDTGSDERERPAVSTVQDAETGGEFSLDAGEADGQASQISAENDTSAMTKVKAFTEYPEDELEPDEDADADLVHIDGTDIFENDGMPEDNVWLEESFAAIGIAPIKKSRYQRECYLKFGFEEIDSRLKIEEVCRYLHVRGCSNNALTRARKREALDNNLLDLETVNHCDFCGVPLSGVSYERLNDGRIRCNDCSASAITTVEELRDIFYRALEMMEMFYGISIHVPISVKMADARTIAKGAGRIFKPSTQFASRVLGYAQRKHGKYSLLIENGSPRLAMIDTMVHELTHIWQYLTWSKPQVQRIYGMGKAPCTATASDIVYEGMAVWASIQYLYQIGETYYAAQQEEIARMRQDIYGIGYRLYSEQYPIVKDLSLIKYSPFSAFPTLEPSDVRNAVKAQCKEKECVC